MAKRYMQELNCPHCQAKTEMEVWDVVNVSLNSAMKASIKDGTFFDWTCPECGKTARIFYPLLYIDMLNSFMIWTGDPKALNHELYNKMTTDGYKFRYVRNYPELAEKIVLLENEFDDYALETMKFTMLQAIYKQGLPTEEGGERKGPVPLTMQFRALENDTFAFVVVFKDAKPAVVKVTTASYEALKKDLSVSPFMKKFISDTAGKFQMVDITWGRNASLILNTEKRGAQIRAAEAAKAAAETSETPAEE